MYVCQECWKEERTGFIFPQTDRFQQMNEAYKTSLDK